MSQQTLLAKTFVFLADTLVDDFDVVDFVDHLVEACINLLDIEAAALLLDDQKGHLAIIATSSEQSRLIEALELDTHAGPSIECVQSGAVVECNDLQANRERWPFFVPAAVAAGFGSVVVVPLRLREQTIGSLSLLRRSGVGLAEDSERVAQALAAVATIGIIQQRSTQNSSVTAQQLEHAITSRVTIEQAKGVLAERHGITMELAFETVRSHARNNNLKLTEAAHAIVRGDVTPILTEPRESPA
ncbi:MAG: GAF and ANTAR domain-containing protein [Candidatus Nanopelagicales bacterium]